MKELSERQDLWESMLGADIRSHYFAALSRRYRLACYGVAAIGFAGSLAWLATRSRGSRDLYLRWQTLANELKRVWDLIEPEQETPAEQSSRYRELQEMETELSRDSIPYPSDQALMGRCQDYVERMLQGPEV